MTEYHVGCGITAIFAGTLNKKGDMWLNKSDVTDEALSAVAQYLLEHYEVMNFNYKGKKYRLTVTEIKDDTIPNEGSNHEFSDSIAKAAEDLFGIDLKKGV